jgi:competence protein ComEC
MRTVTALLLAAALWVGCLWSAPPLCALLALVMLAAAVWPAVREHHVAAVAITIIGMVLLGAGLAGGRAVLAQASPLAPARVGGRIVDVGGRVVTEPRSTPFGRWMVVRVSRLDGKRTAARVLLRLDRDLHPGAGERQRAGGRGSEGLAPGDAVAARMRITEPPDRAFGRYLRSLGVVASADPVSEVQRRSAPAPMAVTTTLRLRAIRVFATALPETPAALLGGLVVGSRDGIPTDELAASGLSHLVVVSGQHVAVLLAGLVLVSGACGLGVRGRCRTALIAVWWFVLLTRWEPSVLRAAVMASVGLFAMLRGRARDTVYTLAATVVVLLLSDPLLARQTGFALSVLATAGVLGAVRWTAAGEGERQRAGGWGSGRGRVIVVLAATASAQVATAPVVLTLAGTVSLAALPANLVASPAAAVAQTIGLVSAALAGADLPGAVELARLAGVPVRVVWWSASAFTWLPALTPRHLVLVLVPPLAVAALRAPRAVVACVVVITLAATTVILSRPPAAPDTLRLTVLDVGQGDGLLVEAPNHDGGARMVIDGGPDPVTMATDLRAMRVRALDVLVLTHGDHDHSGGVAEIVRRLDVAKLVLPWGAGTGGYTLSASARQAIAVARARRVPIVQVQAGMRFTLGESVIDVLYPRREQPAGAEPNTASVVLRVTGRHGRMLLTGDSDVLAQQQLLERPQQLRADVLKVPHHGGATNAPGFLDAVRAAVAVVSAGRDNTYGHPNPDTLADLAPVPVWRTDRHGAITVSLTEHGPVVEPAVYTARDERSTVDVSVRGSRGAAAPPRGRSSAGGAARRGAYRGHRRSRGRPARAGVARPAHWIAVRRPPGRAPPRRSGAAGRRVYRSGQRARWPAA